MAGETIEGNNLPRSVFFIVLKKKKVPFCVDAFELGPLIRNDGSSVDKVEAHLDGKYVLLYFADNVTARCKKFSATLIEFVNTLKKNKKNVECVFVSADKEEKDFRECFGTKESL